MLGGQIWQQDILNESARIGACESKHSQAFLFWGVQDEISEVWYTADINNNRDTQTMAEFDAENAQAFQSRIVERVREMERMLDRDVVAYYRADRVDSEADARENLRGLHRYLKQAYQEIDRMLDEIEKRPEYR